MCIAVSSVIRDTNTVFTQVLGSRVRARAFPVFSTTPTGHGARSPSGPSYPVTIDWNGEKMRGKVFTRWNTILLMYDLIGAWAM